jgi:hypothetical protein
MEWKLAPTEVVAVRKGALYVLVQNEEAEIHNWDVNRQHCSLDLYLQKITKWEKVGTRTVS